jgi:DinB superfamily
MTDPDVAAVITELDGHRDRFEKFCRSLSEDELNAPVPNSTWLVRDYIAHLGTIDVPIAETFRARHAREEPAAVGGGAGWNVDTWNDKQVEDRRSKSLEELLAEAAETRAVLRVHLAALTAEDVAQTMKFGGDSKRAPMEIRFLDFLRGWCKHDPIHVADMIRGLPRSRWREVADWIDDPMIQGYQRQMNPDQA